MPPPPSLPSQVLSRRFYRGMPSTRLRLTVLAREIREIRATSARVRMRSSIPRQVVLRLRLLRLLLLFQRRLVLLLLRLRLLLRWRRLLLRWRRRRLLLLLLRRLLHGDRHSLGPAHCHPHGLPTGCRIAV
jgi:hypothetical protein